MQGRKVGKKLPCVHCDEGCNNDTEFCPSQIVNALIRHVMFEPHPPRNDNCWMCEDGNKPSKEHIIPQHAGGRRTVTGFLCLNCNNKFGSKYVSEIRSMQDMLFPPVGKRGVIATDSDGFSYIVNRGEHNIELNPKQHVRQKDTGYQFKFLDEKTVRRFLEDWCKKHAERHGKVYDPEALMATMRTDVEPIKLSATVKTDFNAIIRTGIVSALALAFDMNIPRSTCLFAIGEALRTDFGNVGYARLDSLSIDSTEPNKVELKYHPAANEMDMSRISSRVLLEGWVITYHLLAVYIDVPWKRVVLGVGQDEPIITWRSDVPLLLLALPK